MSMSVLAVVTSYTRPVNVPKIIKSLKDQTYPVSKIVVVDNMARDLSKDYETYPSTLYEGAGDVWRMTYNLRNVCRFAPALMMPEFELTWLLDDDLIPGSKCLEHLVRDSHYLRGQFATLGTHGRVFRQAHPYYKGNSCPAANSSHPVEVDLTCRTHLVRTGLIVDAMRFQQDLFQVLPNSKRHFAQINDDFLMCQGIQKYRGLPSYIPTASGDPETAMIKEDLDTGTDGVWRRPGHFEMRNEMVEYSIKAGWEMLR